MSSDISESFLKSLQQRLNKDNATLPIDRDYQYEKEKLRKAKLRWLRSKILYDAVKLVAMTDVKLTTHNSRDTTDDSTFLSSLMSSELPSYLSFPGEIDHQRLFGITPTDMERLFNHIHPVKDSVKDIYRPLVEEELLSKWNRVVGFYTPIDDSEEFTIKEGNGHELSAFIEANKHAYCKDLKELKKERYSRDGELFLCYKAVVQTVDALERLMSEENVSKHVLLDQLKTDHLSAKCNALDLKIRVIELRVLNRTYNEETVPALRIIKDQVDDALNRCREDHRHLTQSLAAYDATGPGFDQLVAKYRDIKTELDNKQWAMRELNVASNKT